MRVFIVLFLFCLPLIGLADCLYPDGHVVPVIHDQTLCQETACAQINRDGKQWRIIINSKQFAMFPALLQKYIMLHGCGHLYLGHIEAGNLAKEEAADCWAMNAARNEGFTKKDRNYIVDFMRNESSVHRIRADALLSCPSYYAFR